MSEKHIPEQISLEEQGTHIDYLTELICEHNDYNEIIKFFKETDIIKDYFNKASKSLENTIHQYDNSYIIKETLKLMAKNLPSKENIQPKDLTEICEVTYDNKKGLLILTIDDDCDDKVIRRFNLIPRIRHYEYDGNYMYLYDKERNFILKISEDCHNIKDFELRTKILKIKLEMTRQIKNKFLVVPYEIMETL